MLQEYPTLGAKLQLVLLHENYLILIAFDAILVINHDIKWTAGGVMVSLWD